jgi:hypothetical protein
MQRTYLGEPVKPPFSTTHSQAQTCEDDLGVTHCPLITTIGLGSACHGTPLIRPCRLDDGIHAVDTPDKHHPDPNYALNELHQGDFPPSLGMVT